VPDAIVNYRALDKFDAPGSTYESKADATGSFSIRDIAGAVLSVAVSKDGYYMIDAKSKGLFADGIGPDDTRRPPPSIDSPAIFVLHKMGVTEPLIAISSRTFLISRDGRPVAIDLRTGNLLPRETFALRRRRMTKTRTASDTTTGGAGYPCQTAGWPKEQISSPLRLRQTATSLRMKSR